MCPEKINLKLAFQGEQLLKSTDIGLNINTQLKNNANYFEWYSLDLDQLTDVIDTDPFILFEEPMPSLKGLKISLYKAIAWTNYR